MPLSDEEKKLLEKAAEITKRIEGEAKEAKQKERENLRKTARQSGKTAATLKELKSENGAPFEEEPVKRIDGLEYRKAIARRKLNIVEKDWMLDTAYFCPNGCDWVLGKPFKIPYDNTGPSGGTAGSKSYCKICGEEIGYHITTRQSAQWNR